MNGPDHYREAERLLQLAESCDWTVRDTPYRDSAFAAAKAHAALAHAAAVTEGVAARGPGDLSQVWAEVVNAKQADQ